MDGLNRILDEIEKGTAEYPDELTSDILHCVGDMSSDELDQVAPDKMDRFATRLSAVLHKDASYGHLSVAAAIYVLGARAEAAVPAMLDALKKEEEEFQHPQEKQWMLMHILRCTLRKIAPESTPACPERLREGYNSLGCPPYPNDGRFKVCER